tara:strand:+ start:19194 stop:19847 length:654 start_codon:yes stop_codon:yes gene_type:complete
MNIKLKVLGLASILGLGTVAQGQLIITGIYDGNGSDPKGIELFVGSSGSFEDWTVKIQSNDNTSWSVGFTFDATEYTAGTYIYISSTASTLEAWNWDVTKGVVISDSSFNQNGDDRVGVYNDSDVRIDIYGVDGQDGTGEAWEYTDSYAYRDNGTGPSSSFVAGDWIYGGPNALETGDQEVTLGNQFGTYAIPEAEFYGAIVGMLVLGLAIVRRRRS